ncbi:ABC transporter permease [Halarsenatibacter silvermanii]|uniref:Peptide/nickel transport system permease protein n=1 Tax=Halarsenatibacter silvermanii TaxID=321763 RepID=A0A1G9J3R9_9FIRM|nr:ABC transporter permease [Halarsenatibacter silvermanii]SDL31972.1 peptide/nickel transport system permease protein [Halarsenatibacter silvermanii]
MTQYIIRRILWGILTVITVSVLIFAIVHAMPGDPVRMVADPRLPSEEIEALREQWGLDRPLYEQFFVWFTNILRGDMGTSIQTRQPVNHLISARLFFTLYLTITALILRYTLGIAIGMIVAVKRGGFLDKFLVVGTVVLRSLPDFWLGIILILLFAIRFPIFPVSGYEGPISVILPMLALALPLMATTMRLTRSEVLEVLREQYVRTARAKGLHARTIMLKHVLRNALIPVTVVFFLSIPWLIGGTVVVETVFAWPGMGRLLWQAISSQDLPIVQGIVFIIAVITVISNTLGDIVCAVLDPTIRYD